MSPDWPKWSTPSGTIALPRDRAEPGQRRRMAVDDRDQRRAAGAAAPSSRSATPGSAARPGAARQSRCRRSGEVTASSPAPATSSRDRLVRGERLGRDRAAIGDRQLGARRGLAQPVAAGDDRLGERPASIVALRLLERPRRQPEIDRVARRRAGFGRRPSAAAPPARRHRPARRRSGRAGRCRSAARRSTGARRLRAPA